MSSKREKKEHDKTPPHSRDYDRQGKRSPKTQRRKASGIEFIGNSQKSSLSYDSSSDSFDEESKGERGTIKVDSHKNSMGRGSGNSTGSPSPSLSDSHILSHGLPPLTHSLSTLPSASGHSPVHSPKARTSGGLSASLPNLGTASNKESAHHASSHALLVPFKLDTETDSNTSQASSTNGDAGSGLSARDSASNSSRTLPLSGSGRTPSPNKASQRDHREHRTRGSSGPGNNVLVSAMMSSPSISGPTSSSKTPKPQKPGRTASADSIPQPNSKPINTNGAPLPSPSKKKKKIVIEIGHKKIGSFSLGGSRADKKLKTPIPIVTLVEPPVSPYDLNDSEK